MKYTAEFYNYSILTISLEVNYMKKRITEYIAYMDKVIEEKSDSIDFNKLLIRHMTEIKFFMHERLIHLIVTVTFAILTLISFLAFLLFDFYRLLPLVFLFFVLLVPYIFHYYVLENGVQKMYQQYDKIWEYINKGCLQNIINK